MMRGMTDTLLRLRVTVHFRCGLGGELDAVCGALTGLSPFNLRHVCRRIPQSHAVRERASTSSRHQVRR